MPSLTGKVKWNREAIDKLLSNENIPGECCSRKPLVLALFKLKIMASWIGIFISGLKSLLREFSFFVNRDLFEIT